MNKKADAADTASTSVTVNNPFESLAEQSTTVKPAAAKRKTPAVAAAKPRTSRRRATTATLLATPFETVVTSEKRPATAKKAAPAAEIKMDLPELAPVASPVKKRAVKAAATAAKPATKKTASKPRARAAAKTLDATAEIAAAEPQVELSPVFRLLADPVLPELKRENRARLQIQSPTRAYFYWSVRENPYALLKNAFGETGSYTLVVKLTDTTRGREEIHPCEAEGSWWFDVDPDSTYQAEIGFYAPNRPYFRILYSNIVSTPRRGPSPHPASEAQWRVSANKFAEVLDASGFTRDAFDVAMAGDDPLTAEDVTRDAFSKFIGGDITLDGISPEDLRYALVALASGISLAELRSRISPALFAILQANAGKLAAENALSAIDEYFDVDQTEFAEEQLGPAVYGASLVNFPRTLKRRKLSPAESGSYKPLSSRTFW